MMIQKKQSDFVTRIGSTKRSQGRTFRCSSNRTWAAKKGEFAKLKTLKDVKPGDKVFILNSNRGYLKEPQIETLTVNKVEILYIYVESSLDVSFCNITYSQMKAIFDILGIDTEEVIK